MDRAEQRAIEAWPKLPPEYHDTECLRTCYRECYIEGYIRNILKGRWGEVADGKVVKWTDGDKRQFEREMWDKCNSYINDLME